MTDLAPASDQPLLPLLLGCVTRLRIWGPLSEHPDFTLWAWVSFSAMRGHALWWEKVSGVFSTGAPLSIAYSWGAKIGTPACERPVCRTGMVGRGR